MAELKCGKYSLPLGKQTYIMGILNITPDSFSDGGEYYSIENAVARAKQIELEGADIIDIGAQSTRPSSEKISADEEGSRLLPVLEALQGALKIPVSVDTFYPKIAKEAIHLGADIINDITAFENPEMLKTVANSESGCIAMRSEEINKAKGVPLGVKASLLKAASRLKMAGIDSSRICLDPGIGFNTSMEDCLEIIRSTKLIKLPEHAYLIGASRKRVIARACGDIPPKERLYGSIAVNTAVQLSGADILRVHDVAEARQAAIVTDAVKYGFRGE